MSDPTHFQYCQKLFLVDESADSVLLARRRGEEDFDGIFSLIGGKMERSDVTTFAGISREKREEIGASAVVDVLINYSYNVTFVKNDGNAMVLPHYYARYMGGEILLNEEYSDFRWVALSELDTFSPMIDNIDHVGKTLLKILPSVTEEDFVRLK